MQALIVATIAMVCFGFKRDIAAGTSYLVKTFSLNRCAPPGARRRRRTPPQQQCPTACGKPGPDRRTARGAAQLLAPRQACSENAACGAAGRISHQLSPTAFSLGLRI